MPWVEQIRVADGRTIQPKQYESAKAEREMIISFAPGELKTDDLPTINRYYHDVGQLVKLAVDEELGITAAKPAPVTTSPPKTEPAKPTPTTPAPSKPAAAPSKKDEKPAAPVKNDKPAPETVEGEPAYDRNKLHWNCCPRCGNQDIAQESDKLDRNGKPKKFQACFGDIPDLEQHPGIFLNADGKIVPMKVLGESA